MTEASQGTVVSVRGSVVDMRGSMRSCHLFARFCARAEKQIVIEVLALRMRGMR